AELPPLSELGHGGQVGSKSNDTARPRWRQRALTLSDRGRVAAAKAGAQVQSHPRLNSIVGLGRRTVVAQGQQRTSLAAAGAAFWLVVASFPAAIATISIFGLVIPQAQIAQSLGRLTNREPGSLGDVFSNQVTDAASGGTTALSISLVVSVIISVWGASAGAYGLGRAIRLSFGLVPQNYVVARFRSFVAGFLGVIILGLLALLSSFSAYVSDSLSGILGSIVSLVIGLPIVLIIIMFIVMGIFRFGIGRRTGFRALLPGAGSAAIGLMLLLIGFGFYLAHFNHYTEMYGAVAGIVISMLLAYLSVYLILLAAILNAELLPPRAQPNRAAFASKTSTSESPAPPADVSAG
ncbi:MAG: YihY/virulence factor BrkB family protein, partial [Actinomycetes bacterium]